MTIQEAKNMKTQKEAKQEIELRIKANDKTVTQEKIDYANRVFRTAGTYRYALLPFKEQIIVLRKSGLRLFMCLEYNCVNKAGNVLAIDMNLKNIYN